MLVLSRKEGERIRIGEDILITIVRINAKTVRIGIDAPADVSIIREELSGNAPSSIAPLSDPATANRDFLYS